MNTQYVKNIKADRLNRAAWVTVRGESSSFPSMASHLTTTDIDKLRKASAGNVERATGNSFNVRLQNTVSTAEVIDPDTEVLKIEETAVNTEVTQDGKPAKPLTQTSRRGSDLRNVASNKETGEDFTNMPRHHYSREQPACKYPDLQMKSAEFNHLFENITNLYCGNASINYLTYLDRNSRTEESPWDIIKVNFSAIPPTHTLLSCKYCRIERRSDYRNLCTTLITKVFVSNKQTIQFPFKDEFAKVTCFLHESVFNESGQSLVKVLRGHNNVFAQVLRNDGLVQVKKADKEKDGRIKTALGQGMSVLMVGLDSTSRMNFMRKLPKTFKYFTETLEGHVLKGYHVIGDATTAQFLGMLTGFHEEELPNTKTGVKNSTTCDVLPLVWNEFRRMGYTTMHAEDWPQYGTFQFRLRGFIKQPTDYYMRTFWVTQDVLPESKEPYCFGATPQHHFTLKYVRDFVEAYHNIPKFAIAFLSELSHESLNMAQVADEDILTLIKSWKDKGYLNSTVFILFADHGARFSGMRELLQGRLEERLPFFGIAVPRWMKETHPEIVRNLKKNEERLTTAFDFHKMLQHIMDYPGDPASFKGHGISLFQEIPLNRTCEDASIADHWCTCLQSVPVDNKDQIVQEAADFAVSYMNKLTEMHRSLCAELSLDNITHAEIVKPNEKVLEFVKSDRKYRNAIFGAKLNVTFLDLLITLKTRPNGGAYEVSVNKWLSGETLKIEITGDISRINAYGDHPRCIQDNFPHLKKYCFCREFLKPVPTE
ncbi:hypothetical protein Bbelb_287820 [Branchiostoma belcheri]|nr:hypothetical protein Bbelb_287820 [Branchiostoma belcheri]